MRNLLPREHGAWGLLLQPFAAAIAVMGGRWTWLYLAVLGLTLGGFLVREPLVVWLRHRYLWKKRAPIADLALRYAAALLAVIGASALALGRALSWLPLIAFCGIGLGLTVISVKLTLANQQRSIALQAVSAAGLTSSCLLAAWAALGDFPRWAWLLWGVLAVHAIGAIPVVHAWLQFKARKVTAPRLNTLAAVFQVLVLAGAGALYANGSALWLPMAFSALANAAEVWRVRKPENLAEPVKEVGRRLLLVSLVHTVLSAWAVRF